eukprot:3935387-Rhodomonas_salina.2
MIFADTRLIGQTKDETPKVTAFLLVVSLAGYKDEAQIHVDSPLQLHTQLGMGRALGNTTTAVQLYVSGYNCADFTCTKCTTATSPAVPDLVMVMQIVLVLGVSVSRQPFPKFRLALKFFAHC